MKLASTNILRFVSDSPILKEDHKRENVEVYNSSANEFN